MQEQRRLVTYPEAMQLTGLSQRVFYRRLSRAGIPVYVPDTDRRRRLLDRRDMERLVQVEPVERSAASAA